MLILYIRVLGLREVAAAVLEQHVSVCGRVRCAAEPVGVGIGEVRFEAGHVGPGLGAGDVVGKEVALAQDPVAGACEGTAHVQHAEIRSEGLSVGQRLLGIHREGRDDNGNFYSVYTWCALMYFVSGLWKEQ